MLDTTNGACLFLERLLNILLLEEGKSQAVVGIREPKAHTKAFLVLNLCRYLGLREPPAYLER